MMQFLRWWPSVLAGVTCALLTAAGIAVMIDAPFAALPVFVAATLFLFLGIASRFVPLDLGSYARKMRSHALVSYAVWRQSHALVGCVKDSLEKTSFNAIDKLLVQAEFCDQLLYSEMDEAEEEFWRAYLRYRVAEDEAVIGHNRVVRRLCLFLRERRKLIEPDELANQEALAK